MTKIESEFMYIINMPSEELKIEDVIKYCDNMADGYEDDAKAWEEAKPAYKEDYKICEDNVIEFREDANKYRKVADWLRELKAIHEAKGA